MPDGVLTPEEYAQVRAFCMRTLSVATAQGIAGLHARFLGLALAVVRQCNARPLCPRCQTALDDLEETLRERVQYMVEQEGTPVLPPGFVVEAERVKAG